MGDVNQVGAQRKRWAGLVMVVLLALCTGCGAGDEERVQEPPTPEATVEQIDVWLDVDPAIGLFEKEVDDGVMLLQAFNSPELLIHGVSVVFGNASRDNGLPIAKDVVSRFGPSGLGVYSGAGAATELGTATEATEALARALEQRPMTVLAVGPVTNVGSLLMLRPELASRIESLVMVAARRVGQSFRATPESTGSPFRDFNFELDPDAMQVILDSEVPLVFAPWEVSSHVWVTDADLEQLAAASASGQWLSEQVASWIAFWKRDLGTVGFNPFDTLAVAWLTHPELIASVDAGVWIQEDEDDVNPGQRKPFLYVDETRADIKQAIYTYRPQPAFKDALLARLAGVEEVPQK